MSDATPGCPDIIAALERRVRSDGGAPLLTWYGPGDERVELSGRTVATWADKIASFLEEEGLAEGDVVAAPLLAQRPAHWVSAVWLLGAWQLGVAVALDGPADVALVGPGGTAEAATVVECSLHPLGMPGTPATGHVDFAELRLQPDAHQRRAWDSSVAAALGAVAPRPGRALVTAGEPWPTLAQAVVAPLLGGGSTVLVEGAPDQARLARIAAAERVTG